MEEFILCKSALGEVMEVEIEDDGSVSLDTLKSQFGPQVATLIYVNENTGRERLVRVSGNSLFEPKDGWKMATRVYSVSCGTQGPRTAEQTTDFTPSRRALISHPMIKRETAPETNQLASIKPDAQVHTEDRPIELTKKQLLSRMKDSPIARTAVYQWNKLNTAVRILVHKTTFHGSGGMLRCEGTTKEEALLNQQLREMIANDDSVKSQFSTFYLEDGSGKVVLDALKAYDHVRHVLNDMRRVPRPPRCQDNEHKENSDANTNTENGGDDLKEDCGPKPSKATSSCDRILRSDTSQNITARGKKRPAYSGTATKNTVTAPPKKKRPTSAASRMLKASQDLQNDEEMEVTEEVDEIDDRSEYERNNDAKRHANKIFLHEHVLGGKPKLQEGDAVLIARAWFNVGEKVSLSKITEECDDLGLVPPENQMKLRAALAHLGNELVDNHLVKLKRPAGITIKDIEFSIPRSDNNSN